MDYLELSMEGYIEYAQQQRVLAGDVKGIFKTLMGKEEIYTQEQLKEIDEHRKSILEKYRNTNAITRNELAWASNSYKNLNQQQIFDILIRFGESAMRWANGMDFNKEATFFSLTSFPGVIIDYQDVFAIGLVSNVKVNKYKTGTDTVVCVLFTNDPYVPAFPLWYCYDLKFGELISSKQARVDISNAYKGVCPNLTYPIMEVKDLLNIIKREPEVKGNINKQTMEKLLMEANNCSGIFDTEEYDNYMPDEVANLLESYGYIRGKVAEQCIGMESKPIRDFWMFHMKNLANTVNGQK